MNNYTKNFKNELNNFISKYENDENILKRFDSKIIKELSSLIMESTNFSVKISNSKKIFNKYKNEEKNEDINFSTAIAFEFDFDSYSKESYFKKNIDLPYIIFKIKNKDGNLNSLSNLIGNEIKGDLVFMVRYVNERWELPLKSFSILKESINEIILFKAISFEMEVNKSASLLNESNNYYKDFIIKNLNIFSTVCFSPSENLFSNSEGLLIAESFLEKDEKNENKNNYSYIEDNKNGLFYLNSIYDYSIKF